MYLLTRFSRRLLSQLRNPRLLGDRQVGVEGVRDGEKSYGVKEFLGTETVMQDTEAVPQQLMEKKYDYQFKVVFEAIRELMAPPRVVRRQIGFRQK